MSTVDNDQKIWYVRKGSRVHGQFSVNEIRMFLVLGRVHPTDEVSLDHTFWEPVSQVPEMIPDALWCQVDYTIREKS